MVAILRLRYTYNIASNHKLDYNNIHHSRFVRVRNNPSTPTMRIGAAGLIF